MHSLSEYSWRTCYHMWSKLTFKEKGGEKCHVYSTERTRNVTLGATNLTFNGGLWVISEKKNIHYLQLDREQSFQTLRQRKLIPHGFLLL